MRSLLLVLALLAGGYFLFDWYQEQRATPFRKILLEPDTATVRRLTIDPAGPTPAFSILRDGHRWIGRSGSTVAPLMTDRVKETLAALSAFRTDSLLARVPALTASNATEITIHLPEAEHRFLLKPHENELWFSLSGQQETYLLDNPDRRALLRPFLAYRDPVIFSLASKEIASISRSEQGTDDVFSRDSMNVWREFGEAPAHHDSLEIFLQQLRETQPVAYADDFLETDAELRSDLVLKGPSFGVVRLRLFRDLKDTTQHILHTSQRSNDYLILPDSFRLPKFRIDDPRS